MAYCTTFYPKEITTVDTESPSGMNVVQYAIYRNFIVHLELLSLNFYLFNSETNVLIKTNFFCTPKFSFSDTTIQPLPRDSLRKAFSWLQVVSPSDISASRGFAGDVSPLRMFHLRNISPSWQFLLEWNQRLWHDIPISATFVNTG